MSDTEHENIEDIKRHVRHHIIIAGGLAIGTALTIWASLTDFHHGHGINIAIAMAIATIQGFLILGFYMNLLSEKKMIYSVLVFTVVFFVVQMGVTLWARMPDNVIHN